MRIVDFSEHWVPQAKLLVEEGYQRLREEMPWLSQEIALPDFTSIVTHGLGVAVIEGEDLLAFLSCYRPFPDAFHTTGVKGVFCPLHGHAIKQGVNPKIFEILYQTAAEKWVAEGILSHAICLYQNERDLQELFFMNGFGVRCMDLARENNVILPQKPCQATFRKLEGHAIVEVLPMNNRLIEHLGNSPVFMKFPPMTEQEFLSKNQAYQFYVAELEGKAVAYLRFGPEGENFVANGNPMIHCIGAFALPEHRGSGIMDHLLAFASEDLRVQGYPLMGVDCESLNPNARFYWQKHFTAYTYSVVRRIDDKII